MDAITARNRTIWGQSATSLCAAAGYCSVGVDEGWEACGVGVNGTQHDATGRPTINTTRFPSMKAMVDYGHSKGLQVGWYQNGCKCAERVDNPLNYRGDVASLVEFGYEPRCTLRLRRFGTARLLERRNQKKSLWVARYFDQVSERIVRELP